jgi:hypothetical protein
MQEQHITNMFLLYFVSHGSHPLLARSKTSVHDKYKKYPDEIVLITSQSTKIKLERESASFTTDFSKKPVN